MKNRTSRKMRFAGILLAAFAFITGISAQQRAVWSSLIGNIADATGAGIPGATVRATNVDTNVTTTATSDATGVYIVTPLIAGTYRVTIEHTGFKTFVEDSVVLASEQTFRVDAGLQVGSVTENVVVTAEAPLMETESATIASTRPWATLQYLPSTTTDWWFSVRYEPGANAPQTSMNYPSMAGSRVNQYDLTYNGTSLHYPTNGSFAAGPSEFAESIGEVHFSYVNNNAEFATATALDARVKNGTNLFHGTAVYSYSSGGIQARNPYSITSPSNTRFYPSAGIGGPIKKDRLFFFVDYYGARSGGSTPYAGGAASVPSVAEQQGIFPTSVKDPTNGTPFPNNTVPQSRWDSVTKNFLQQYLPQPNYGPASLLVGNYRVVMPAPGRRDDIAWRVDYRFNEKHSIYVSDNLFDRGWMGDSNVNIGNNYPTTGSTINYRPGQALSVSDVYTISPRVFNEADFGYADDHSVQHGLIDGPTEASKLGLQGISTPAIYALPSFTVSGFNMPTVASDTDTLVHLFSFRDSVSYIRGSHRLKFGISYYHGSQRGYLGSPTNYYGTYSFNGFASGNAFADYLLGLPSGVSRNVGSTVATATYIKHMWEAYAQDDFQVSRKLTLSYGVRYQDFPAIVEANGLQDSFNPATGGWIVPDAALSQVNPAIMAGIGKYITTASKAGYPQALVNSHPFTMSPRIGLAYRLSERTVVRSGFGIFRDYNPPLQNDGTLFAPSVSYATNTITNGAPAYALPNVWGSNPSLVPSGSLGTPSPGVTVPNAKVPYTEQWNLTVERQLSPTSGIRVSYIGVHTVNGIWAQSINVPYPSTTQFTTSRRPFPAFGTIVLDQNGGTHMYQSMQIAFQHQGRGGLYFRTYYVLAKDIGVMQAGDSTPDVALNPFNRNADSGNNPWIPRHQWVTEMQWSLPVGHGKKLLSSAPPVLDRIIGGWSWVVINDIESGDFLTPICNCWDSAGIGSSGVPFGGGTLSDLGGRADIIGNPSISNPNVNEWFNTSAFAWPGVSTPGRPSPLPTTPIGRFGNAGTGILVGPGYWTTSMSLRKAIKLNEKFSLTFYAIADNVFNHFQPGDPNMDLGTTNSNAAFGTITATRTKGSAQPRNTTLYVRLTF